MTQMVAAKDKINNVRAMLDKLKPQIALALPKHMNPDRMARVAMTSILRTPKLLECDAVSLMGAIVTCSQLGLEPDPVLGHAHLVPFRNRRRGTYEVTVIPGYKGLMKLARNSGEIATIDAKTVHQKDHFVYMYGLKPMLEHRPYQGEGDPGPATHYYAVGVMKTGHGQFVVMTAAEVAEHGKRFAQNFSAEDSPWQTDRDAMGEKTCIRELSRFLPASVELQRANALDTMAEAGIPQDLGSIIDITAFTEVGDVVGADAKPASKLDKLADEHEKKPAAAQQETAATTTPETTAEASTEASGGASEDLGPSPRASKLATLHTLLQDGGATTEKLAGDTLAALTGDKVRRAADLSDDNLDALLRLGGDTIAATVKRVKGGK